jgi:hypothetical protein
MTDDRLRMAAVAPGPGGEPLLTAAKPAIRTTPEIVAQPTVCQQAAPGNVCTRDYLGGVGSFGPHVHAIGIGKISQTFAGAAWQRPRRVEIFALPENKILGDKAERASLFRLQE